VKLCPPARKETDPSIALPLLAFGVLNRQEATPLEDFAPPLTFVLPAVATHATPVGFTGEPPRVTRTEATSVEPAFGFAGESFTALAATEADPPPPLPPAPAHAVLAGDRLEGKGGARRRRGGAGAAFGGVGEVDAAERDPGR
jgi:hypothetical protein